MDKYPIRTELIKKLAILAALTHWLESSLGEITLEKEGWKLPDEWLKSFDPAKVTIEYDSIESCHIFKVKR